MAASATFRTFWGALLSVLLKCIAALGFHTPATRTQAAAPAPIPAGAEAGAVATAAAVPAARGAGSSGGSPSAPEPEARPVPAPRLYEPVRSSRDCLLPPTMKQRISAEAHGATPAGRSLPAGTLVADDGYGGLMTVPAPDDDETARRAARRTRNSSDGAAATSKSPAHDGRSAERTTAGRRRFAALHG
ncbi:MAG: DUF6344 domain-containing protein [Actinomycetia bacterium]|nr:DUF6344 domain-containing protein [Actinomycetes bacterium]